MNRYRNAPGLRAPPKATASTLCQKCLKRDKCPRAWRMKLFYANSYARHYSYECTVSAQDRPYVSRPSRTQQLQNPDLVPKLTSEVPNDLLRTKGVADEVLAKQERERGRKRDLDDDDDVRHGHGQSRKRARSISSYSSDSVSTISTNLSRLASPQSPPRYDSEKGREKSRRERASLSPSRSRQQKRRYSESSSEYSYSSHFSVERRRSRTRERELERNTRRKRRESSPDERGRRRDSSLRGSWRDRTQSPSRERSRIVRGRRSMTPETLRESTPGRDRSGRHLEPQRGEQAGPGRARPSAPPPRERSLSPYSKRVALTQAMSMGG